MEEKHPPFRWLVDAALRPGGENTGKLVDKVRHEGRELAMKEGIETVIIDGPPGIGCPVISAITGTDLVVAVVEPTVSAIHDLKRLLELAGHFQVPVAAVINREDIDTDGAARLREYLAGQGVEVVGGIPYDPAIYRALEDGRPAVDTAGLGAEAIVNAWERVKALVWQ
jgi:MinD superfamily P-loop ATPase